MPHGRRWTSLVLAAALALQLGACTSLRPQSTPPGAVAPRDFPRSVRLVLADSSRVDLYEARLDGDTIRGSLPSTAPSAVPVAQVVRWEARRASAARTLAAAGAVGMLGLLVVLSLPDDIEVLNGRPPVP